MTGPPDDSAAQPGSHEAVSDSAEIAATPDEASESSVVDPAPQIPRRGRLVGVDCGTKRIGVAVTDICQEFCSPLHNYNCSSAQADAYFFMKVVEEYEAVGLIFGLPLHMSGDESKKSREAKEYGNWLSEITALPVAWVDERYSTRFAMQMLEDTNLSATKRKAKLDKIAAQAILTAFLETLREG